MRKLIVTVLLLIFYFANVIAQETNIPSWYSSVNSIEKIVTSDADSAFVLIENAQKIKLSEENELYQAHLMSLKAMVYMHQSQFELAEKENRLSEKANIKSKYSFGLAYNYYISAQIAHRKSDFVQATQFYHKSISAAQLAKNYPFLHKVYIGLSGIYLDQAQYDKALEYAQKSVDLYKISKNETQYLTAISFLAETYRLNGNFQKSEKLFQKSYDFAKKIKKEEQVAWILGNWSLLYDKDLNKSLQMSLEAQSIWNEKAPEGYLSVNNLGNIGWCYHAIALNDSILKSAKNIFNIRSKEHCLDLAEDYYKKAIEISQKTKTPNIYLYFSQSLSELQASRNNYEDAYQNLLLNKKLNDSVYSQKNKNKIAELENAREIALKDKQIEIKNLTIKSKERQSIFFIILTILAALIGILLYFQSKIRKDNNLLLKNLNNELELSNKIKNRFFNILNHDLRSPLAHIIQFYQLKDELSNSESYEKIKSMETQIMRKSENLMYSMDDLLLWGKSQMENFIPHFQNISVQHLFDDIQMHFSYLDSYYFQYENQQNIEMFTDENYLKTILRNLTANAIKAIENEEIKNIIWQAKISSDLIILKITDSGKNAQPQHFESLSKANATIGIKNGLGLHLIREMAEAIKCKLEVDIQPNQSTSVSLIWKL